MGRYETWTTYGFGFCVDDIYKDVSLTIEKILNLAKMEPSVYKIVKEQLDWICERDEVALDELDICDLDEIEGAYGDRGLVFILHNVITEIDIVFADNYSGDQYILYTPSYPWRMKADEKSLSEEDVVKIFAKYIKILTDEPIEIGYQSVENGC